MSTESTESLSHLGNPTNRFEVGDVLQHYQIGELLGRGGMGDVYQATDTKLRRDVALKLLPLSVSDDPERRRRLLREARAAAAIDHPAIAHVYEIGRSGPFHFIAMEWIQGRSLAEAIAATPPPIPVAVDWATQIAEAMRAAHEAGVIHRDLKPSNLMVAASGQIKVLDFGIAKPHPQAEVDTIDGVGGLTAPGATPGTVAYMSPEQILGEALDHRTDIFSLGMILFELLTGQRPFDVQSESDDERSSSSMRRLLFDDPPPLMTLCPSAPIELEQIVETMLRKSPADRYSSMTAVAAALRALARAETWDMSTRSGRATSRPPATTADDFATAPRPSRGKAAWLVPALLLCSLLVVAVTWTSSRSSPPTVPEPRSTLAAPEAGIACPLSIDDIKSEDPAYELWNRGDRLLRRSDRQGNIERAIDCFQQALTVRVDYAPAHAGLALAFWRRSYSRPGESWQLESLASAREAVRLAPHLSLAQISLAYARIAAGRLDKADEQLNDLAKLDPENADIPIGLAEVARLRGKLDLTVEYCRRATDLAPGFWLTWSLLGDALYRAGKTEEAARAYESSLAAAPDNAFVLGNLAAVRHRQGDYPGVIDALQRSLIIHPTVNAYSNLGTAYFFEGHYRNAAEAFEAALAIDTGNYLIWANLGDAFRQIPDQSDQASTSYAMAIRLARNELENQPNRPEIASRLALYLARSGQPQEAKAVMPEPEQADYYETPGAWYRAALIHEALGERGAALDALARALELGYPIDGIQSEPELVELRGEVEYHRLAEQFSKPVPRLEVNDPR